MSFETVVIRGLEHYERILIVFNTAGEDVARIGSRRLAAGVPFDHNIGRLPAEIDDQTTHSRRLVSYLSTL